MRSAFGVEHGYISKSLVNGKWVKAAELGAKGRRSMGGYKQAKGVTEAHKTFLEGAKERRGFTNPKSPMAQWRNTPVHPGQAALHGDRAVTVRLGGAKGGQSHIFGHASDKESQKRLMGHEASHANVKRSEYRLHGQIFGDHKKLMREEARADMDSDFGHYRKIQAGQKVSVYGLSAKTGDMSHVKRSYPHLSDKQAREGVEGYKKVQDKIARSRGEKLPPEGTSTGTKIAAGVLGTSAVGAGGALWHSRKKNNG
jgi:hypothetical protein